MKNRRRKVESAICWSLDLWCRCAAREEPGDLRGEDRRPTTVTTPMATSPRPSTAGGEPLGPSLLAALRAGRRRSAPARPRAPRRRGARTARSTPSSTIGTCCPRKVAPSTAAITQTRTKPIPRDASVATLIRVAARVGRSTAATARSLRERVEPGSEGRAPDGLVGGARVSASAGGMLVGEACPPARSLAKLGGAANLAGGRFSASAGRAAVPTGGRPDPGT